MSAIFQGNSSNASGLSEVFLSSGTNSPGTTGQLGRLSFSDNGHTATARIAAQRDGGTWTSGSSQPSALTFSTTADGSASPTERARLTSSGALLVGTTSTPTTAGSGAVVAQDRVIVGSSGSGLSQVIVGETAALTATTGTVVFTFTGTSGRHSAYIKLMVNGRANNDTVTLHPACEYAFKVRQTLAGNWGIEAETTIFEYVFVRATHFAFTNLGTNQFTITLTNPTASAPQMTYKIEALTFNGNTGLTSVAIT
jgi:hypothetical protein